MSGPKRNPEPDPNYPDADPAKTTAPTTREEQLKSPEARGDVPAGGAQSTTGTSGGELAKDIGTKDELQQQFEMEGGATRVHRSEERTTPKEPGEGDRPGEMRNPGEKHGQRGKGFSRKG